MPLTRTQVILSMEYALLSALNNAVRCQMAQENIDAGTCQFDGWHYETSIITDNEARNSVPQGAIMIGGVRNGAEGSAGATGIPQTLYILADGAPEMLLEAQAPLKKTSRRKHRK